MQLPCYHAALTAHLQWLSDFYCIQSSYLAILLLVPHICSGSQKTVTVSSMATSLYAVQLSRCSCYASAVALKAPAVFQRFLPRRSATGHCPLPLLLGTAPALDDGITSDAFANHAVCLCDSDCVHVCIKLCAFVAQMVSLRRQFVGTWIPVIWELVVLTEEQRAVVFVCSLFFCVHHKDGHVRSALGCPYVVCVKPGAHSLRCESQ